MNSKKLLRIGDISLAFAMMAAVSGALSLMSVDSMAFAKNGSDDGASSGSSSGSSSNSGSSGDDKGGSHDSDDDDDDHDDDHGGHGSDDHDDDSNDDHGHGKGGHGGDREIIVGDGTGNIPEDLVAAISALETAGFEVLTIKREDGSVVEAKVIDEAGVKLEIYFDVATSTVLSQHVED